MTARRGLGRHGRLAGLLRAVALRTGLAGRVRSGAVRSGAGLALTLLAGLLRPGSGHTRVLTGWRDGRLHRVAGHRLAGELLARLRRARAAVGWSALLRVGLVAGPALLARVWWTLLTLSARPRGVLAAAVLLPRTLLTGTLLTGTLLTRTLLTGTLPSRPLLAWTVQTLLTGTLLIWALLIWALLTRTVGARTVLPGAVLRWTLLRGAVLSRTRLALLRRAVLAGLRLSLLRVVTVLAGRRAVRRGLTLLTGGSAVLAGRRATVLLALLRWLGPVGLVGILRCAWPALLGAARAGLRRKWTGRSLLAVRLLLALSGMPALRGALLTGRRVLRMLVVGWLFSLVLVCRWTLTWHS